MVQVLGLEPGREQRVLGLGLGLGLELEPGQG